MQPSEEFTGLGMPVFTAFGWAGEETAQKYAYSQLEQYVALLHESLNLDLRNDLPYHGLSTEDRSGYLAAEEDVEDDVHVTFNVRPVSLETQLALTNKAALNRAFKQISTNPALFLHILQQLGPEWTLRLQQVQLDKESGDRGHYQDIYKGPVADLDEEKLVEIIERATYLNPDDQWVTPIYLSMLTPADQVSAMQTSIVPVMSERMNPLAPIVAVLQGRAAKTEEIPDAPALDENEPQPEPEIPAQVLEQADKPLSKDEFVYATSLKPLHIKRGFINMTPEYWPFFAINARTESRPVTVLAGEIHDEDSAVWRLQPNDLARLVLGPKAHRWLEEKFVSGNYIQLAVNRMDDGEIQVVLDPIS